MVSGCLNHSISNMTKQITTNLLLQLEEHVVHVCEVVQIKKTKKQTNSVPNERRNHTAFSLSISDGQLIIFSEIATCN